MYLAVVSEDDLRPLYDFEYRNKEWFEHFVPPRDPGYFFFDDFTDVVAGLLNEQEQQKLLMFVVYKDGKVVARINLTNIQGSTAEIGYRVCQSAVGNGLATRAVSSVIQLCKDVYGIHTINAMTTENNRASQSVLLKNGFVFSHREKDAYVLNGQSVDFVFFQSCVGEMDKVGCER